jgi:hypothetical protein
VLGALDSGTASGDSDLECHRVVGGERPAAPSTRREGTDRVRQILIDILLPKMRVDPLNRPGRLPSELSTPRARILHAAGPRSEVPLRHQATRSGSE